MGKFSRFGLAFNKSLLIRRGANPVFYVAGNSLIKEGGKEVSRAELFDRFHERIWRFFSREAGEACQDREVMDFLARQVFGYGESSMTTAWPATMTRIFTWKGNGA